MVTVPLNVEVLDKVPVTLNTVCALALASPSKQNTSTSLAAVTAAERPRIVIFIFENIGSPSTSLFAL